MVRWHFINTSQAGFRRRHARVQRALCGRELNAGYTPLWFGDLSVHPAVDPGFAMWFHSLAADTHCRTCDRILQNRKKNYGTG